MFKNWFKKSKTTQETESKRYRVYENGHKTEFVFDRNADAVHKVNELARSVYFGAGDEIKFSEENVKLVNWYTDETIFVWEIKEEMK